MDDTIAAANLTCRYGSNEAVTDLSLRVASGTIFALRIARKFFFRPTAARRSLPNSGAGPGRRETSRTRIPRATRISAGAFAIPWRLAQSPLPGSGRSSTRSESVGFGLVSHESLVTGR